MLIDAITRVTTCSGDAYFEHFNKFPVASNLAKHGDGFINEHLHSCHLLMRSDKAVGRFALYINKSLAYNGVPAICIGAYACIADEGIAESLLDWAQELCIGLGYSYCLGPMNGSTWYSYRFSRGAASPEFAMDVSNPDFYNTQFWAAGFEPIAEYNSSLDQEIVVTLDTKIDLESHFKKKCISFRNIDLDNLEEELSVLAEFSNVAFKDNFLFTPIASDDFVRNYSKLKNYFEAEFIWLAEDESLVGAKRLCSIVFAVRDICDPTGKTLIIKTIAAQSGFKHKGLTTFLTLKLIDEARSKGFMKIIHALMHKENISLNTSRKSGIVIKEYVLYGKQLNKYKLL